MLKHCFLFSYLLISGLCLAQKLYKINGKVVYKDGNPAAYVNVKLLKNNLLYHHTETNSEGFFEISCLGDRYNLNIEQFGEILFTKTIHPIQNIDFKELTIDKTFMLDEISIAKRKKQITHKGDKLIFNVDKSPFSIGNSALEVLRKSPKISIDSKGIPLLQNREVTVLVNGRRLHLSGLDLSNYLENLNSEDVKHIEIQDIAPLEQDASNKGGVVNLVLKNQAKHGFRFIGKGHYLNRGAHIDGLQTSVNLNFTTKKWNVYSTLSQTYLTNQTKERSFFDNKHAKYILQIADYKPINNHLGLRLGGVYLPNSKNEIGVEAYLNTNKIKYLVNNELYVFNQDEKREKSVNQSERNSRNTLWYFTVNHKVKLDSLGSSFRFLVDFGNSAQRPGNVVVSLYEDPKQNNRYVNLLHADYKHVTI